MTVFKTILKILNKLKGIFILYTIMLLSITMLNQTSGNKMTSFEESKPDILIVNRDTKNIITNNFISYLKKQSKIKNININDEEAINDAIFYRE